MLRTYFTNMKIFWKVRRSSVYGGVIFAAITLIVGPILHFTQMRETIIIEWILATPWLWLEHFGILGGSSGSYCLDLAIGAIINGSIGAILFGMIGFIMRLAKHGHYEN
jgi:hypothetical protein